MIIGITEIIQQEGTRKEVNKRIEISGLVELDGQESRSIGSTMN